MKKIFSSNPSGVIALKIIKLLLSCLGLLTLTGLSYGLDGFDLQIAGSTTITAGSSLTVTIRGLQGGSTDSSYNGTATVSVSPNPGTISTGTGTPTTLHFSSGNCTETSLTLRGAGNIRITIKDNASAAQTTFDPVTVQPGTPHHLILLRHSPEIQEVLTPGIAPGWNYHGVTISAGVPVAVSAVAVDQYYNACTGTAFTFGLQIPTSPYYSNNNVIANTITGFASFAIWTPSSLSSTGERYDFSLSSSPLYQASLTNLTNWIYAPNNAYMWIDAPSTVVAGVPFYITVAATSLSTRTAPATWVNYSFSLNPKLVDGSGAVGHGTLTPSLITLSGGTANLWCTYPSAERMRIVPVCVDSVSGKTFVEGFYQVIDVVPAAPAAPLTIAVSPANLQAQKTAVISVTVRDAYLNPVPGAAVNFDKISGAGDSSISAPSAQTDTNGLATITFQGGIVNEIATVRVTVGSIVQNVNINISVAPPSGGEMINYPNPFNPLSQKTSINYYLKADSEVEIKIYDAFGRMVLSKKIAAGQGSGDYATATASGGSSFMWDGCNGEGQKVGNGIYVVKVIARNSVEVQKFTRRVGVLK